MNAPKSTIRMIALDLDGTLLRSDSAVSPRTLGAIQEACSRGVVVAIATGRMYATASPYGKLLGLGDIPMMLYAGGLIQTVESKRKLFEQAIDVRAVVCGDDFYTPQGAPNKLLSRGKHEELVRRREIIEEAMPGRFTILFSDPTFLEIMPKGVNKGIGLHRLGELFQVPVEQIMAVGDSPNDVDMLKEAGFAVAMDNASPAVKDVVDYVTAGNDDDGVAKVIEKFVL